MKEVANHTKHLEITFNRLIATLFTDKEIDALSASPKDAAEYLSEKKAWIKTSCLAVEGVSTEYMVLSHLLWFQHIGRIVIDDIDPYYGAVLIHLNFNDVIEEMKAQEKSQQVS